MDLGGHSVAIPHGSTADSPLMVNWNEGSNHNPIDPKAVKIGAEQEDYRAVKPWSEAQFLLGRVWASVSWPMRMLRCAATRPAGDRER